MKQYNSPTFEWIPIRMSDLLTTSNYEEIAYGDNGNLDDNYSDIIYWS